MKQSKNFYFSPNAMKFTLLVAISKERLNLKVGENLLNDSEDVDHFLVTVGGKSFFIPDGRIWINLLNK